ncbi:SPFH/Band 7/PHB domain protein [Dictyocaulus viviparus]|uniref:SPFH/Band 7/PHB domain protein n=1 Tax=Dictyocaulus viviparus TaxID=29172 RepID=A0A0D8Y9K2_DICVI|nr:SPFH/Band 7/PHB domain protein [Dictyocaulus viviparus]
MNSSTSFRLLKLFSRSALPLSSNRGAHARNTFINFVPQQEAWVVERMGKFYKILEPGFNVLIPIIDKIRFVQSLREIAIEIPQQGAITLDNVQLQLDGVLYLRVFNPYRASYGVDDPEFAVTQLAQTTMRSEVGKISLDTVFREREQLNVNIVTAINKAAEPWGIKCMRYEIRDMHMPTKIQEAMQMQINVARGHAEAIRINAEAKAEAIERIAKALNEKVHSQLIINLSNCYISCDYFASYGGDEAASLTVAQQYVTAFEKLAKDTNTVLLPANLGEPSSMVAQALALYQNIGLKTRQQQ